MTYTVGICDDCPEQVDLLTQYLEGYPGISFRIVRATDPGEFLVKIEETRLQLVFLDIDMGAVNGIQVGEKIKELYENTVIIYITAYEKYALEAFRVRAFHYLLKPLTRESFSRVLEEALKLIGENSGNEAARTFTVQTKGEIISLNYSEIYYFEKVGHKIMLHTENRDIYYYGNLSALLGELDEDCFVQCHQGYIANADKIRGLRDKTLFLNGNIKLPVSRSYAEYVKEILEKRLFAGKERR